MTTGGAFDDDDDEEEEDAFFLVSANPSLTFFPGEELKVEESAGHAHAVDHSHRERYARDAAEKNPRSLHHFIGVVRVMFVCARPPSARCNFFSEVFVQNVFRVACCV